MRTPALLLALAVACTSFAQRTPDELIKTFFNTYSTGKEEKAVDDIYKSNPWLSRNSDGVENLKRQLVSSVELMGEYRGYGLLGTKDLATDLVMYDYMVKYDRQPLRFRFMFYRADKEWILYSISFDDTLDDELEELVKGTYLHH